MTLTEWFIFFLAVQVIHFLGTWKLYVKAGRKAWEAAIPVYNAVVLMKIINRSPWWTLLLFVPIINLIMFPVIWVETIRSFGKNSYADTFLVLITLGFYIFYVNYAADVEYIKDRSLKPKSSSGEWTSSILFAVVAATLVHTYFMQPFVIPTSSLEKTLLVGDFLFVSKFHYGARTPMTTVAAPMVHDSIPKTGLKSYFSKPQLPYFRFPGFQDIKHNEIVVFNWPVDTVLDFHKRPDKGYYKPIDKRSNYVKRCVGLPGDSLEVRDGYVYINGEKNILPDRAKLQFYYNVKSSQFLSDDFLINEIGTTEYSRVYTGKIENLQGEAGKILQKHYPLEVFPGNENAFLVSFSNKDPNANALIVGCGLKPTDRYSLNLSNEEMNKIKGLSYVSEVTRNVSPKGEKHGNTFPRNGNFAWNNDNFGPIFIPKKGTTVKLNKDVLPLYKRVISEYEQQDLAIIGDEIFINGEQTTSYTFKQDYYWMMGDNRQNSQDARTWGYVPADHIVGKPVFKWMSWDSNGKGLNKIRWNRMFTTVGGSGEPIWFLPYFAILMALWWAYNKFVRKKKPKEA